MKKILLLVTLVLAMSSLGWAGACSSGLLSTYTASGFSCTETIGGDTLTFSGFRYANGGTAPLLAASDIMVTVLSNGFSYSPISPTGGLGMFSVGPNEVLDFQSVFHVSGNLTSVSLALVNYGITNYGFIVGREDVAILGGFYGTQILSFNKYGTNCQSSTQCSSFMVLPPVTGAPITIEKDLVLSAGSNSSAFVGAISNDFNTVPEPASMLLFGSGLLALGGYMRRRQRK